MSEPEESPGDKSPPPVADESQPVTEESSAEVVDEAAQPATEESSAEVVDEAAQPATEESSAEVVESPEGEKSVGEAVHEQAEEVTENAKTVIADVKDFFTSEVEKKEEDDKTAEATDGETSDPYPPTTETTPLPEKEEEVSTNGITTLPDHRTSWANCCGLLDLFHQNRH